MLFLEFWEYKGSVPHFLLKEMAKKMGGRWDPEVRLWYIKFGKIKGTDLEKHIILDASMKGKTSESI